MKIVVDAMGGDLAPKVNVDGAIDALREFDHEPVTAIWAQCPDAAGLGLAVSNRLKKAAGFHVIEV